uniref:FRA10A associated CGG repeat 1 n=1 Tax=Esox lucius TaxID=8010 RepID=A0A6Q2WYC6_ESOLU
VHGGGGYDSDFSDDEGQGETSQLKRKRDDEILRKPFQKGRHTKLAHRDVAAHEYDREEARNRRHHLISMNAYERHKKFVSDYILYYGGKVEDLRRSTANDKSDLDVVRENHRFLWRDEDEEQMTWEKELAKKYYDKLFKEYCIADLSRYKENKFGFRWRIEKEVVSGKGQFVCGNKRCEVEEGLKSWEVNFAYVEQGEKRNALVKLSKILLSCLQAVLIHGRSFSPRSCIMVKLIALYSPPCTFSHVIVTKGNQNGVNKELWSLVNKVHKVKYKIYKLF